MYGLDFREKRVAAQIFLVTLEGEGDYTGELCTTSKEATEAMLKLARRGGWTNRKSLKRFSRKESWNTLFSFRLNKAGLTEIYELADPLLDKQKDAKLRHMIYGTGEKYKAKKPGETKRAILNLMQKDPERRWSTIEIAMEFGLHPRTVQRHLNGYNGKRMKGLVEQGLVRKVGSGRATRYVFS